MLPLALRVGYKLGKYALKGALKAHSAYYYGTLAKEVSEGKTEGLESHAMFSSMGKIKPITTKLQRVLVADRKTGGLKKGETPAGKTYVFADNVEGWGKGGQAVIRNQPGAFGIPSKISPNKYMIDSEFASNKANIDKAIAKIPKGGETVISKGGIGTGLAQLKENAPKTYNYLQGALKKAGLHPNVLGNNVSAVSKFPEKIVNFNSKALKNQIRHVSNQAKADIKQAIKEGDPYITVRHSGSHGSELMANIYRKAVLKHNKTSSNKLNYQEQNLNIKINKSPVQKSVEDGKPVYKESWMKETLGKDLAGTSRTFTYHAPLGSSTVRVSGLKDMKQGVPTSVVGSRLKSFGGKSQAEIDKLVGGYLDKIKPSEIITGGAKGSPHATSGVDLAAQRWGIKNLGPNKVKLIEADWGSKAAGTFNPSAGFDRNTGIIAGGKQVLSVHRQASKGTADSMRKAKESGKPIALDTDAIAWDVVKHKSKDISYQNFLKDYPVQFKTELGITRSTLPSTITIPSLKRIKQGSYFKGEDVKLNLSNVKTSYQPRIKLGEGKYQVYDPGSIKGKAYTKGGTKTITSTGDKAEKVFAEKVKGKWVVSDAARSMKNLSPKYSPMFQGTDVKSQIRMAGDKELIKQMINRETRRNLKSGKPESVGIVTMSHPNIPTGGKNPQQAGWYNKTYDKWMRDYKGDRMTKKEMILAKQAPGSEGTTFSPKNPTGADPQAFGKDMNISTKDHLVTQVGKISTASFPPTASARAFVNWLNQQNKTNPLFKGKISINTKTGKPIITASKTKIKTKTKDPLTITKKDYDRNPKNPYGRHPKKSSFDYKTKKITEPHVDIVMSKSKPLIDPGKTAKFKSEYKKKPKKT